MSSFQRDKPWFDTSLSLWRFRSDRSEISHFYWTGAAQSDLFAYTIKSLPLADDPMLALSITDLRYERRLGHSVEELKDRFKSGIRWRRLTTVVLMASAFERYLVGVAETAIESDPTRMSGFPKKIDGLTTRKHGIRLERPALDGLVRGTWPSRLKTYRVLFGSVPTVLQSNVGDLERLRKMRNTVAHGFAYADAATGFNLNLALGSRRSSVLGPLQTNVGEKQVIQWLRVLGEVSEAVDEHLCEEFIGGFEVPALFIDWRKDPDRFERDADISLPGHKKSDLDNRFASVIGTLLDRPPGLPFVRSVRKFVDKL